MKTKIAMVTAVMLVATFGFMLIDNSKPTSPNTAGHEAYETVGVDHQTESFDGSSSVPNSSNKENVKIDNATPLENEKLHVIQAVESPSLISLKAALENVYSENINDRIMSMQVLTSSSPSDAVTVIYDLLSNLDSDEMAVGMVALGLLSLANKPEALSDEDLDYIYHGHDNDNVRARSARVLAHRGDDRLLTDYVKKYADLAPQDIGAKYETIMELANLQSRVALPYISKYLSDSNELVRLQAVAAIEMTANGNDIELVRPLLYDSDEAVRQLSREVINNLLARGQEQPVPMDILLNPSS